MGVLAQANGPAVNVPFDKAHFSDASVLKQAVAAMKKANALAEKGGLDQAEAMALYAQAAQVNPDNAELNLKMGICMLNGPAPATALPRLQRAAELDGTLPRVHYLLGYAYQLNAKWQEAIVEYKRHGEVVARTPDPDRTYNMVGKRISECNYGKSLMANPSAAQVFALGAPVNTVGSEYGAVLDGKGTMYFTSRQAGNTGGKVNKVNNNWFEDMYSSVWGANGWSIPQRLPEPVNSVRNDATVAVTADGQGLIIYRDESNGGDLFMAQRMADGWNNPVPLPATVNSIGQESSAWPTADGKWLYFVSSREGGMGGSDIYRSPWDAVVGNWGTAENLGPAVNTVYDEEGVFLTPDGKTLYFASQGHSSMGGYDLFKSTMVASGWSKPENLGWPVNSPGDDQFLVLSADGSTGYFNSVRPGGMGEDDIYRVQFPAPVQVDQTAMLASMGSEVPIAKQSEQLRLEGFIKGLKMMPAEVVVIEIESPQDPSFFERITVDSTGGYSALVPAGREYTLHVLADGYLPHSERVEADRENVKLDMNLSAMDRGNTEVMRSILFRSSSYELDSSSVSELVRLEKVLNGHAALRLEIGGHTDSDTGAIPNQPLSEARARVVLNWLVAHGIAPDRLEAKGYGDTQPVAPNNSAAGKALNRRTEIRVL